MCCCMKTPDAVNHITGKQSTEIFSNDEELLSVWNIISWLVNKISIFAPNLTSWSLKEDLRCFYALIRMISLFFKVSVTLTSHTPVHWSCCSSARWWDAPVTCQVDRHAPVTCQVDGDARTNRFFFCVHKRLKTFTLRWKLNIIQLLWFHRVKQSQTAAVVMIQMNIFTSVRFNTELGDGLFPWRFHKYITQITGVDLISHLHPELVITTLQLH